MSLDLDLVLKKDHACRVDMNIFRPLLENLPTSKASWYDGVVFDWEDPCAAGAPTQRWYAVLIGETKAALKALSPSYQVSTCVAWSPDDIDGRAYDAVALGAASDLLYIMDYDTRSQVRPVLCKLANSH